MKTAIRILAATVLAASVATLTGCQSRNVGGARVNYKTGETLFYSKQLVLPSKPLEQIQAITAYSPATGYAVVAKYCSFFGWAYIHEAVANNRSLPIKTERHLAYGTNNCAGDTVTMQLSPDEFRAAAASGFSVSLNGERASTAMAMPAEPFRDVLARSGQGPNTSAAPQRPATAAAPQPVPPQVDRQTDLSSRGGIVTGI